MAASWPSTKKTFTAVVNGITKLVALLFNSNYDETEALQTYLGAAGNAQSKLAALNRLFKYLNPTIAITWIDEDTIEIAPTAVIMHDGNNYVIKENTSALQIQLSVDLDTGSEAAATWYDIYLIGDGSNSQYTAKFVLQGNTPSGATYYKKIFAVRNDASGNIIKFCHVGKKVIYDDVYGIDAMRVLNAGSATSFADVDCSALVPAISSIVSLQAFATNGTDVDWRANGSSATAGIRKGADAANQYFTIEDMLLDSSGIGEYKVNAGGAVTLWVKGYELNLL